MRKPSYAFPQKAPEVSKAGPWTNHGQRSRGPVVLLFIDVSLDNLDKTFGI